MRAVALALALILLPAARASADIQIKPFIAGTFGGATTFGNSYIEQFGDAKRTYGVTAVWLGGFFGVEGDFGWTPGIFESTKRPVLNPVTTTNVVDSGCRTFTGNVVIAAPRRVTEYTLRPYLSGGGGLIQVRSVNELPAFSFASNLQVVDVGGGATGFLTDRVGVSWDLRYFRSMRGKIGGFSVGAPEELSFWRINMAFVVRLRHHTR